MHRLILDEDNFQYHAWILLTKLQSRQMIQYSIVQEHLMHFVKMFPQKRRNSSYTFARLDVAIKHTSNTAVERVFVFTFVRNQFLPFVERTNTVSVASNRKRHRTVGRIENFRGISQKFIIFYNFI